MKHTNNTREETSKEGLPKKITLFVTGGGNRTNELGETDLLLKTEDATLHFSKNSEFGKLAHAIIDTYNERGELIEALEKLHYHTNFLKDTEGKLLSKEFLDSLHSLNKSIAKTLDNAKNLQS